MTMHATARSLDSLAVFPAYKGKCRVCGKKVPKGRLAYCSDECHDRLYILCFPAEQRWAVEKRDKGVCATCRCDCQGLERAMKWATNERIPGPRRHGEWVDAKFYLNSSQRRAVLQTIGFGDTSDRLSLWDTDHIVPVVEGGGVHKDMSAEEVLANLRTLCLACHKGETRGLAGRRARNRTGQMELLTGD